MIDHIGEQLYSAISNLTFIHNYTIENSNFNSVQEIPNIFVRQSNIDSGLNL